MTRSSFLQSCISIAAMNSLQDLKRLTDTLETADAIMPVLFAGHGSPMNAIEENEFTASWKKLGATLPAPKAIVCISAHWLTRGTFVTAVTKPKTIHDFGGFPKALFDVEYPAPGHPELARDITQLVQTTPVKLDTAWGFDHGSWSVIKHIYPKADIPMIELSIDYTKPAQWHYDLAKELLALRKKGVLIIGSGNTVHNLRMVDWNNPNSGYDWAIEMNETIKTLVSSGNHKSLVEYDKLGKAAQLAIPTPDHYWPMLYTLGLQQKADAVTFFNDKVLMGSLNMTSFVIQ